MQFSKRNPHQRELDDAKNVCSKVEDKLPHDIAIVEEIRKEYTLTQELAIIRKALVHMGCDLPEFVEWNSKVNEIKSKLNQKN